MVVLGALAVVVVLDHDVDGGAERVPPSVGDHAAERLRLLAHRAEWPLPGLLLAGLVEQRPGENHHVPVGRVDGRRAVEREPELGQQRPDLGNDIGEVGVLVGVRERLAAVLALALDLAFLGLGDLRQFALKLGQRLVQVRSPGRLGHDCPLPSVPPSRMIPASKRAALICRSASSKSLANS